MPLTRLQSLVLTTLASQRSPDSYVAGGIAINRDGVRYSRDIDLFQDSEERLESAAEADAATLAAAGFHISDRKRQIGRQSLLVRSAEETVALEWVADSDFRFFPAQPDALFGYVLHPIDLATNKASAAADRRVPRDIVDLLTIHDSVLSLGAVVAAAVGRFPGTSPEEMLAEITRHSRFTAEEFRTIATAEPIEIERLHRRIRKMLDDAAGFIAGLPSDDVGFVFLDGEKLVQPAPGETARYSKRPGSRRGIWPSSPEISRAMLSNYGTPKEQ